MVDINQEPIRLVSDQEVKDNGVVSPAWSAQTEIQAKRDALFTRYPHRKIHPIIIYPFKQPTSYDDLEALYNVLVTVSLKNDQIFTKPITVLNRQTYMSNAVDNPNEISRERFLDFLNGVVMQRTELINAWSVDTCQMWLSGLGYAFDKWREIENYHVDDDIFWLIPGDFRYSSSAGLEILIKMLDIPKKLLDTQHVLSLGEIKIERDDTKELIDLYGTLGLLLTWFPSEAREIRQITNWPRSEFFAIRGNFLRKILGERWYPYEQTVVILLHCVFGNEKVTKVDLGEISDHPQGRNSHVSAIQQVERTERLLKQLWRERQPKGKDWTVEYRRLDLQSEQIRGAALEIFRNLLQ